MELEERNTQFSQQARKEPLRPCRHKYDYSRGAAGGCDTYEDDAHEMRDEVLDGVKAFTMGWGSNGWSPG